MIVTKFLVDLVNEDKTGHVYNKFYKITLQSLKNDNDISDEDKNNKSEDNNIDVLSSDNNISHSSLCNAWIKLKVSEKKEFLDNPPEWMEDSLSPKNFGALWNMLENVSSEFPNIHPIIPSIIGTLGTIKKTDKERHLIMFWNSFVLKLLHKDSSDTKTFLILVMLEVAINFIKNKNEIDTLINEKLVAMIVKCCNHEFNEFEDMAKKLCTTLTKVIKEHKENKNGVQFAIIKQIISQPGCLNFDKVTNTKTLALTTDHLNSDTIKSLIKFLVEFLSNNVNNNSSFKQDKNFVLIWLSKLISHPDLNIQDRSEVIIYLMTVAFFSNDNQQNSQILKNLFFKSIDQPSKNLKGQIDLFTELIKAVDEKLKSSNLLERKGPIVEKSWKKIIEFVLNNGDKKLPEDANNIFMLFYSRLALELFVNQNEAEEVINELHLCLKNAKKKKNRKSDAGKDDEPAWVDVITDLLISLLLKPQHSWRTIVLSIFRNLCPLLTVRSMEAITDVLSPDKTDQVFERDVEEEVEGEAEAEEEEEEEMEVSDAENEDDSDKDDESEEENDYSEVDEGSDSEDENDKTAQDRLFEIKKQMFELVGATEVIIFL